MFVPSTMEALVYDSKSKVHDDLYMSWDTTHSVPVLGRNEVLIKTESASLNPYDFRVSESTPMMMAYNHTPVGCDIAGEIVAVGTNVEKEHQFRVGDRVFGFGHGLATFAKTDVHRICKIPTDSDPKIFGALPCVAVTVFQLLHKYWLDKKDFHVRSILIIGSSGGVGSALIQIIRALAGPEIRIYGICSHKNVDYCKTLGANEIFDYMQSNFDSAKILPEKSIDLVVDCISGTPEGPSYVGPIASSLLSPTGKYVTLNTLSKLEFVSTWFTNVTGLHFRESQYEFFVVNRDMTSDHLMEIASLVSKGQLKMAIEREIPIEEKVIREALHKLRLRHMRGKILVSHAQKS
jgi:NADPH:quinone reductase-like Zn-dependent oxidoreductase